MKRKHILIIEDDITLALMYRDRLEMAGYDAAVAADGEIGVEKAIERVPDLILLDLMLPKKGGMNVLQVLKTEPVTKNIPVIVLTALMDDKYRQQSLKDGAAGHFIKSQISPQELVKQIEAIIA